MVSQSPRARTIWGTTTFAVLAWLFIECISTLHESGAPPELTAKFSLLFIISGGIATREALRNRYNLPYAIFGVWVYVFLGLAPAYQFAERRMPWGLTVSTQRYEGALDLIIGSLLATLIASSIARRRKTSTTGRPASEPVFDRLEKVRRPLVLCGWASLAANVIFIALMQEALFNARAEFRARLLEIAELPAGGLLYFLVTAGSIIVPSVLIVARREGVNVPRLLLIVVVAGALISTNPLAGSRFLTGSVLVALGAALSYKSAIRRSLPLISVLLLVLLFPTLDILRGDGTGSNSIELQDPRTALVDYDFDAFEMMLRQRELAGVDAADRATLALAPILRWVPILSRPFIGEAGGAYVAEKTGMQFTNVSLPVWAEARLVAGPLGVGLLSIAIGLLLETFRRPIGRSSLAALVTTPSVAALLFIVLRGSIYEVLGYLMLALTLRYSLSRFERNEVAGSERSGLLSSPISPNFGER